MSGRKPRSSISSASSSTSTDRPPSCRWPCWAQVEQPARSAHHDVGAGAQRVDLRLVGASAVDGHHRQRVGRFVGGQVLGRGGEVLGAPAGTVRGWAPRSMRAERRSAADSGPSGDPLQQRNAEREGLAHAGAGLADHVVAGERHRQGEFLDGKCVLDALFGQCADDFVADAEFGKCWCRGSVQLCLWVQSYVSCKPFGDVIRLVSCFSVAVTRARVPTPIGRRGAGLS